MDKITEIQNLIEKEYGIKADYSISPLASTVLTTITQFLKADPKRIMYVLINLGSTALYVSPGNTPSTTNGIYLAPSGGTLVTSFRDDLILPSLAWYGISVTSSNSIYLLDVHLR